MVGRLRIYDEDEQPQQRSDVGDQVEGLPGRESY